MEEDGKRQKAQPSKSQPLYYMKNMWHDTTEPFRITTTLPDLCFSLILIFHHCLIFFYWYFLISLSTSYIWFYFSTFHCFIFTFKFSTFKRPDSNFPFLICPLSLLTSSCCFLENITFWIPLHQILLNAYINILNITKWTFLKQNFQ